MKTIIGIDPGVNTGYAKIVDGQLVSVITTTFWDVIHILQEHWELDINFVVYIEDPNKNKPIFIKKGVQKDKSIVEQLTYNKIAQDVGSNKRDAQLLIEFCQANGFEVIAIRPSNKKVTKEYFEKISGWTEQSSQHGRDAAMLILGRR